MVPAKELFLAVLVATAAPVAVADVEPPDVYARLMVLVGDIEKLRFEMGRPKPGPQEFGIANAAPHEVYFQVATLFRKANRLGFEHTRESSDLPSPPDGDIRPANVLSVVESALSRIGRVKAHLGIKEETPQPPRDPTKTPTDVLNATRDANRQLNLLLGRPFSPAEVYEQVTLAIGYAARLRARFPGDRIPETPPFERGKRPVDVFLRLGAVFASIQQIAARSNLPMLTLVGEFPRDGITPSDVYDIATLLVSELDYLWTHAGDLARPHPAYYPGRKLPSHVYQRAGLLERQLAELAELVEANPSWLEGS